MALRDLPKSPTAVVPELVKDLIDQFREPLTFYRELIQNSIDAKANRVDVTLAYDAANAQGLVRVEDDGEGMDEAVIENYLLVLFKSTKEDDFTKIGQFGIGFVSVFAPRPDFVRVYTAKNGQSWRIDFPSYKRYELYKSEQPREGTLVELTKKMTAAEFETFAAASRETIRRWCRHARARIMFEARPPGGPQPLNEPLGDEKTDALWYSEEGTEVALAYSADRAPFIGFYNGGLTLKEGSQDLFPGLAVKIDSRYLEHTLTRDGVIEDEGYRKALAIVERLAEGPLAERLRGSLGEIAERAAAAALDPAGAARLDAARADWLRRSSCLRWLLRGGLSRWTCAWLRFPRVDGRVLTLADMRPWLPIARVVYSDQGPSPVARALQRRGEPVFLDGPWVDDLAALLGPRARARKASDAFALPLPLGPDTPAAAISFLEAVKRLDAAAGDVYKDVQLADFGPPECPAGQRPFLIQDVPGSLHPLDSEPATFSLWPARPTAVLNARHPLIAGLLRLHERQPGLAAFTCVKLVRERLAAAQEAELLARALRLDGGLAP